MPDRSFEKASAVVEEGLVEPSQTVSYGDLRPDERAAGRTLQAFLHRMGTRVGIIGGGIGGLTSAVAEPIGVEVRLGQPKTTGS